jgi:hypothetical protein
VNIPWQKCASVTPGGKQFFYFGKVGEHVYHVVWDRIDLRYHAQIDHVTVGKFDTAHDAEKFLETQDEIR